MDINWRNSQKLPRFFIFDARSVAAIMLFLLHARLWTFCFAMLVMFIFWLVERRGYSMDAALRAVRSWIMGRRRPAILDERRRLRVDFGGN